MTLSNIDRFLFLIDLEYSETTLQQLVRKTINMIRRITP